MQVICTRTPSLCANQRVFVQLMACIGEHFTNGDDICGIVINIRGKQDRLSIWTRTASNEAVQVRPDTSHRFILHYNTIKLLGMNYVLYHNAWSGILASTRWLVAEKKTLLRMYLFRWVTLETYSDSEQRTLLFAVSLVILLPFRSLGQVVNTSFVLLIANSVFHVVHSSCDEFLIVFPLCRLELVGSWKLFLILMGPQRLATQRM